MLEKAPGKCSTSTNAMLEWFFLAPCTVAVMYFHAYTRIVRIVICTIPPPRLRKSHPQGCAELVRVLLPYSERHFQRLDRLLQSSYLVEHTLASMQMLVAEGDPAGDSNKAAAGTQTNRPLVRELKRLRDGKPRQEEEGEGVDGGGESDSSVGEGKVASPVPVSEVVDGRVVYNVRVENGGAGDTDSDEDSDLQESEDVAMGDASDRDPSGVHVEEGGGEGSVKKAKKKRNKKSSSGASAPAVLGLVGQPVVEAIVPGEEEASGDKKSRKKRRRSAGGDKNVAAESPALVKVQKQQAGAVVPQEGGAVAETGEDGEESGKKKKKKKRSGKGRRKSTTT